MLCFYSHQLSPALLQSFSANTKRLCMSSICSQSVGWCVCLSVVDLSAFLSVCLLWDQMFSDRRGALVTFALLPKLTSLLDCLSPTLPLLVHFSTRFIFSFNFGCFASCPIYLVLSFFQVVSQCWLSQGQIEARPIHGLGHAWGWNQHFLSENHDYIWMCQQTLLIYNILISCLLKSLTTSTRTRGTDVFYFLKGSTISIRGVVRPSVVWSGDP